MNANLAVIADNLDYLLWGRLAEGPARRRGADPADGHRRHPAGAAGRHCAGGPGLALRRAGAASAVSVGGNSSAASR